MRIPPLKVLDIASSNTNICDYGKLVLLNHVSLGSSPNERTGSEISLDSIYLRVWTSSSCYPRDSSHKFSNVVSLVIDRMNNRGYSPHYMDIFSRSGEIKKLWRSRFKLIKSEEFYSYDNNVKGDANKCSPIIEWNLSLKGFDTVYLDTIFADSGDISRCALYLCFINNDGGGHPSTLLNYSGRLRYRDKDVLI